MGRLTGKGAIVLGAAGLGSIGQTIARKFAEEGATVMVAGRKVAGLESCAAEIGGHAMACDITDRASIFALAAAAMEKLGHVDLAVHSTGVGFVKPFEENTPEDLKMITDLQFIGPFQFFQAVLGVMSDGGSIIQISSATATIQLENHAAYAGTKAGIDHVIRCLANDYGRRRIRANSISPGLTITPLTEPLKNMPGLVDCFAAAYPLGRIGTVTDVAQAALYLADDDCFLTGQNLQVNGGLTLRRNPNNQEIKEAMMKASAGAGGKAVDRAAGPAASH